MRTLRLFSILDQLRVRRHPVAAEMLADELNVSVRTIYRDMATLQEMGAPIRGESGIGYQIEKGYFLPPLHFDQDELDAVILGIRMVSVRGDKPFADAALRALGKINAVLSDKRPDNVDRPLLAYSTQSEAEEPVAFLSLLRAAIRERQRLKIIYLDLKEKRSNRNIRPLGLTAFDKVWLLTAWCEDRMDFRNFRIDRLHAVERHGGVFPRELGKEFKDYLWTL
jgi:predicted DNA-binding transcriptional regulator YafY